MPRMYKIVIGHPLDETWKEWFDGLTLQPQADNTTLLTGILEDSTALYTVLNKIRNLNMDLVSVSYMDVVEAPMKQNSYLLSSLLAAVTLIQSAVGTFYPQIFRDPPMTAGNAHGTDIVILFVALPTLVISMILTQRGSLRAQLTWAGALAYILYNAVIFAFATAYNPLFLFYVATLSLAVWSLLALLTQVDVDIIRTHFDQKTPTRFFAGYLAIISLLFLVTWLKQIIPALFDSAAPVFLAGTLMLTSPVHVLDLGFLLPLGFFGAVWLLQKKSWGYLLAGLLMVMMTIETASIAVDQYFGHVHDPVASLDAVPLFILLTMIGLVAAVFYLRYLKNINFKPNESE